jgi:hypothetical protein
LQSHRKRRLQLSLTTGVAKAGAFAYDWGWQKLELSLTTGVAKAGAFAYDWGWQKLELSLTTGVAKAGAFAYDAGVAKAGAFGLPCDNQTGREGFAEKTGAVDRGDRDERAKSGKL